MQTASCDMKIKAEREDKSMKAEREEESSSSKRQKVCMEGGSPERRHYYLARQTLLNMLTARGYVVSDPSLAVADPCTPRLIAHRSSDFSRKIVAIFCEAHQTKKQDALAILSQIVNKEMLDKVILIMPSKMSFHAQKVLDAYPVQVETFMIFDLLKPKLEILSRDDKDKLLMDEQIVAVFCEDYQTKKEDADGILSEMAKKEMVERVVLVMQSKMDSDAQKVLDESPVKVETFMITELQINSTKMLYESKYEIFSHEDKDKLLKDVKKFKPLPESAVCPKYYGLEKGQLLKMSYNISGWKDIFGLPIIPSLQNVW